MSPAHGFLVDHADFEEKPTITEKPISLKEYIAMKNQSFLETKKVPTQMTSKRARYEGLLLVSDDEVNEKDPLAARTWQAALPKFFYRDFAPYHLP